MLDILKALFPIFLSPTDYKQMLLKLASFAFWEVYIGSWVLRSNAKIDLLFGSLEQSVIPARLLHLAPNLFYYNVTGFIVLSVIAIVFYSSQFHNIIANMLKLRYRFDMGSILLPLSHLVRASLSKKSLYRMREQRDNVMERVFYKYTSSMSTTPLVDKHNIHQALQSWSWFWIAEEGVFIWIFMALGSLLGNSAILTSLFMTLTVLYVISALLFFRPLDARARAQIEQIADDPVAKLAVREIFDAL